MCEKEMYRRKRELARDERREKNERKKERKLRKPSSHPAIVTKTNLIKSSGQRDSDSLTA